MHADLVKLLELQAKDAAVARSTAAGGGAAEIGGAGPGARQAREGSRRRAGPPPTACGGATSWRPRSRATGCSQERRQQRLEHVRNPKEASTLMAELDLARSVMAKEETDWVRSARSGDQHERTGADRSALAASRRRRRPSGSGSTTRRAELEARAGGGAARAGGERAAGWTSSSGPATIGSGASARHRRRRAARRQRLRRLPHRRAAQPAQPDPAGHGRRRLRGLRRDSVPAGAGGITGVSAAPGRLPW